MEEKDNKKRRGDREIDFSAYPSRHVVLRLAYDGRDMDGLARQVTTTNTVEHYLIQALVRLRLVPPVAIDEASASAKDPKEAERLAPLACPEKFSRCGRTDKGVSALGNAVSLMVRGAKEGQPDLQYSHLLNRVLPPSIRIIAWAYVQPSFDARFSCCGRTYRYFFSTTDRNIAAMNDAAQRLVGVHDFRNLCKMDVVNVSNFVREIYSVELRDAVTELPLLAPSDGSAAPVFTTPVAYAEIRGNAFLYHQIRCIMAVLFMVADGHEEPSIITELLDVERRPAKPTYAMASEFELVLWDCGYKPEDVKWVLDDVAFATVLHELSSRAADLQLRAAMQLCMKRQIESTFGAPRGEPHASRSSRHVPLLKRPTEHTFEAKVAGLSAAKQHRREQNHSHATSGRDRLLNANHAGEDE